MLRLGKTRLLSRHSSIGSISTRKHLRSDVPPPTTESNKDSVVGVLGNFVLLSLSTLDDLSHQRGNKLDVPNRRPRHLLNINERKEEGKFFQHRR
ncbi:hypothetical protein TNCV_3042871 [Trichonephila clavipes]|nr:hypothetical protein TNCV_3042871 [Trichonephila clavipes]